MIINEPVSVPEAQESTWQEWQESMFWYQTTIPGLLVDEQVTAPQPLELLPENKY